MKKLHIRNMLARMGLFVLILSLGTISALIANEQAGLALVDLSKASLQTVASVAHSQVRYATTVEDSQPAQVYRSDDSGRTWQVIGAGPSPLIHAIAAQPGNEQVLFAGTAGGEVSKTNNLWRSDDSGRSWHKFFLGLPSTPDGLIPAVTALAVDPRQPETLYVGSDGQGVYRFDMGPDSYGYTLVGNIALYNAHVKDLVLGPNSQLYALTSDGLFRASADEWQQLDTVPERPVSLAVATGAADVLYIGTPSSGAYRSDDGGQTWKSINQGLGLQPGAALRITALTIDEQEPQHVVVATAYGLGSRFAPGGVYESRDAGRHWTRLGEADSVVNQLDLVDGGVQAVTATGLVRYGEQSETPAPAAASSFDLRSLAQPSGTQLLILTLTLALASLVLVGRMEWLLKLRRAKA